MGTVLTRLVSWVFQTKRHQPPDIYLPDQNASCLPFRLRGLDLHILHKVRTCAAQLECFYGMLLAEATPTHHGLTHLVYSP